MSSSNNIKREDGHSSLPSIRVLSVSHFVVTAAPWLAGVMIGSLATSLVDKSTGPWSTEVRLLSFLLVMLSAFMMLNVSLYNVIRQYFDEIRGFRSNRVSLHTNIPGLTRSNAFSYCESVVNAARKSIVIVGPHFTNAIEIDTEDHTTYLEDGIAKCIERHVHDHSFDRTFEYYRVIQLDEDVFEGYWKGKTEHEGIADAAIFSDEGLARHIRGILALQDHSVTCRFYARRFVPSFPSILVVDNRFLFFSLPTKTSVSHGHGVAGVNSRKLKYDVVLAIEDQTGEIPTFFSQVAKQFEEEGVRITGVRSQ